MDVPRRFPDRPVVSVGAVIVDGNSVVLIKRGQEPLKGMWSLPGGVVELGETLRDALVREVREETCLDVEVGPVVEVLDRISRAADGRPEYHYVIIDYVCTVTGGSLGCASDAEDARWVARGEVTMLGVTDRTAAVVERAFTIVR